mmetsp:Transcript_89157/g.157992  ORF Transcript_89157/g.157992 Transcript_89157/m.157992 type:complete len:297 (-) Transcript_89157:126-1016(-)
MGNVDGVPVASQVKSVVQASQGDTEAAWATQDRFSRRCIGAAQIRSLVEAARGDVDDAAETQREFLASAGRVLDRSEMADGVPVLAQLKAMAQAADGRFDEAAATRESFTKYCPVVAQVRSLAEMAAGRPDEARQMNDEFLSFASRNMDKVPVLGQLKAGVHHWLGDEARAAQALEEANVATRSSVSLLESAFQDIFNPTASGSGSTSDPPNGSSTSARDTGPLGQHEIREHTLCFMVQDDQRKSFAACPVCMQDFQQDEWAMTLRCFHIFHAACAERWLSEHSNCPVCRVAVVPP